MRLIEQMHALLGRDVPSTDMREYTHQDPEVAEVLHRCLHLLIPHWDAESFLLAGMDIVVAAIREAGELPDDLNSMPLVGAQGRHDQAARGLIASVPERCPDCGGTAHPGTCDEPNILSPDS